MAIGLLPVANSAVHDLLLSVVSSGLTAIEVPDGSGVVKALLPNRLKLKEEPVAVKSRIVPVLSAKYKTICWRKIADNWLSHVSAILGWENEEVPHTKGELVSGRSYLNSPIVLS